MRMIIIFGKLNQEYSNFFCLILLPGYSQYPQEFSLPVELVPFWFYQLEPLEQFRLNEGLRELGPDRYLWRKCQTKYNQSNR